MTTTETQIAAVRDALLRFKEVSVNNFTHEDARLCGNALKEFDALSQTLAQPVGENVREEAEFVLNGELYALIKLRDEMPVTNFTTQEYREWGSKKVQALEKFWGIVVNKKAPFRAYLRPTPAQVDGKVLERVRNSLDFLIEYVKIGKHPCSSILSEEIRKAEETLRLIAARVGEQ